MSDPCGTLQWALKPKSVPRSQGLKISRSQCLKVSRSQGLNFSRSQGLKVSRSQGEGGDGGDRGDGATSVTGLNVNVIFEAVEERCVAQVVSHHDGGVQG